MASQDASGIFSGVFGFIARELESFVTTASGGQVPHEPERSRSSRSSSRRRRKRSKKREPTPSSSSSEYDSDDSEPHSRHRTEDEDRPLSNGHRKRRRKPEPHISKSRRRVMRSPSPSPRQDAEEPAQNPECLHPIRPQREVMGPPPVPKSRLKRQKSTTMPGSLYPRSPSMDPESLSRPTDSLHRVRFVPATPSSHSRCVEQPPEPGPSKPNSVKITNVPTSHSPVRDAIQKFDIGKKNADPSILLPNTNRTTPTKGEGNVTIHTSPGGQPGAILSFKARGKQRVIDLTDEESDLSEHETSGELHVRDKEQELKQAIRQQIENETRRERQQTEEPEDFDNRAAETEKERDKERIRQLEEEIRLLREELAKRPSQNESMFFPPPPPAPPPPPPPNQAILTLPTILDDADAGIIFTAARASLKHQPTPKEKPINPPHVSRRQGQPTVGVTPDKMAAFLHEMKSVRLRKTGQDLDLSGSFSSGSSRALSAGSNSFSRTSRSDEKTRTGEDVSFLSRSMIAPRPSRPAVLPPPTIPRIGDKRKRQDTLNVSSQRIHDARNKRALLPAVHLTQMQAQSSSSGSSTSPVGLFSESSGSSTEPVTSDQGTSAASWPVQSTVPDAPTPSLCSDDNDPEKEDEHDQPPSTPPQILPSRSMYRFRGAGIPVTPSEGSRSSILNKSLLLQAQEQEHEHEQDPAQAQETPQHNSQHIDYEDSFIPIHPITPNDPATTQPESTVFEKRRLPVSPLPAKSPRKPHPPNRRRSTPHPRKLSLPPDDREDEELPPVLTFSTPPVAISTPGPATQVPPKAVSDTPDIFNDSRGARSRPPPSRIPVPSSRLRSSSFKSSSVPKTPSGRWVTLGEELWNAQQSDEINGENDELDEDVYVGTGMRSRDRSFLAHGGAGGPPVLMGVGYVEGAENRQGSPDPYQDLAGDS